MQYGTPLVVKEGLPFLIFLINIKVRQRFDITIIAKILVTSCEPKSERTIFAFLK